RRRVRLASPSRARTGASGARARRRPVPRCRPRSSRVARSAGGDGCARRREAEPQIALLLPEREAREERLPDEVTPPPEHRRDAYALPRAERLVQALRGAGASACEDAPELAPAAHPAKAARVYGRSEE